MGDIADMMLEGVLCERCGVYLHDDVSAAGGDGYPRLCDDCQREKDKDEGRSQRKAMSKNKRG